MVQTSIPFGPDAASVDSTIMDEAKWTSMFRYLLNTGVIAVPYKDEVNELLVTTTGATGRQVQVDSGSAWIQGFYYSNNAALNLNCTANSTGSTRIDMVCLECKWGASGGITAKVVAGTATAPTPTQTYGVSWQIPLAYVTVPNGATTILEGNILDARQFIAAGTAKSSTYVIAADTASPLIRANADAVIPLGSLNAQSIINTAIYNVATYYGGGSVLLSEGTFKTSAQVTMLNGVNFNGLGPNTILQSQAVGTQPVIYADTVTGATISDMRIEGGGSALVGGSLPASVPGADGIRIADGARIVMHHLFIEKCRDNGITITTTGTEWTSYGHSIENCEINNCYNDGAYIGGYGGFLSDCRIYENKAGVELVGQASSGGGSQNMIANNLIASNYRNGMTLSTTTGQVVTRNNITGNTFANNCTDADDTYYQLFLYGAGVTANTVSGNTVYSTQAHLPQYGIILNTSVAGNVVMGNNCANAAKVMANNVYCNRAASTNTTPNWIRFNNSGSNAPGGVTTYPNTKSYDA